jgi:hypothetical protein
MADWIACPGCGLKHSARPDGTCPRCRLQVGAPAPAAPPAAAPAQAPLPPQVAMLGFAVPAPAGEAVTGGQQGMASGRTVAPPAPPRPSQVDEPSTRLAWWRALETDGPLPTGSRAAGWAIYAAAIAGAAILVLTRGRGLEVHGPGIIVSLLIDFWVATELVCGRGRARGLAVMRAVLGVILLAPYFWIKAGWLMGLAQVTLCVGLLLLLIGRPGLVRMTTGLVSAVGVALTLLAMNASEPVRLAVHAVAFDLKDRGVHLESVRSAHRGWRLGLPPGRWHTLDEEVGGMDLLLLWPEEGALLMVRSEAAPSGKVFLAERRLEAVIANLRANQSTFVARERARIDVLHGEGWVVRYTLQDLGRRLEGWMVVAFETDRAAIALAHVPAERFAAIGPELRDLVSRIEVYGALYPGESETDRLYKRGMRVREPSP